MAPSSPSCCEGLPGGAARRTCLSGCLEGLPEGLYEPEGLAGGGAELRSDLHAHAAPNTMLPVHAHARVAAGTERSMPAHTCITCLCTCPCHVEVCSFGLMVWLLAWRLLVLAWVCVRTRRSMHITCTHHMHMMMHIANYSTCTQTRAVSRGRHTGKAVK